MDDELDYDNIIVQNILIRKGLEDDEEYHDQDLDEDEPPEPTVEIHHQKTTTTQTQKVPAAESTNNINSYLVTTLGSTELSGDYIDDTSDSGSSSSGDDSEEYNVIQREVVDLDGDFEIDESSDDSEWETSVHRASVPATKKGVLFACELCEKKCNTKRGLDMHKRAHERRKEKGYE